MKRLWLGLVIVAVLLAGGILISRVMPAIHGPIATDLNRAAAAAMAEDWATAQDLLTHASVRWERFRTLTATFIDHAPLDQADSLFRELLTYVRAQEGLQFSAACAHLTACITAIGDSHRLSWWNLL